MSGGKLLAALKTAFRSLIRSRRSRFELAVLVAGLAFGLLSSVLLVSNGDHLRAMLIQYANLADYQLSDLGFGSKGVFAFIRDFTGKNALAPTVLFLISVLLILAFAISSLSRALMVAKTPVVVEGEKTLSGIYRIALAVGATSLALVVGPGPFLFSTSAQVSGAFSVVEKTHRQEWATADTKQSQALVESMNAHSASGEHFVLKSRAQMDCRGSASATTYYAGNTFVDAGYYNSCALLDYLGKKDYEVNARVNSADYTLSSTGTAVDTALAKLTVSSSNLKAATVFATTLQISQLVAALLAVAGLLVPVLAALKLLRTRRP